MTTSAEGSPRTMIVGPGFGPVADTAMSLMKRAGGGALCVYHHGVPVLDIWAGHRNPKQGLPWEADTMAMAWSTTKGIASAAVHLLVDRGLLNYDDPIAAHWPEFAAAGKRSVTVRQFLSMEAGLYDIRHLIDDPRLMLDHDAMAAAMAAATPAHPPGRANGYHALTYGWPVAELVRRLTGKTLGEFVEAEIAKPLGLDGCHIGTPDEQLARVAVRPRILPEYRIVRALGKLADPFTRFFGFSPARSAAAFVPKGADEVLATDDFLRAEIGAANGTFTARSLARVYAALGSDDGLDGVRLWSPETRRLVAVQQNDRRDRVIPVKMRWRLGYHFPYVRGRTSPDAFGFFGAYGSGAYADPSRSLGVGFVVQEAQGLPLFKLSRAIARAADARSHR